MRWPTLGQQSGIGARSLPQSSGKQDYVSRQVGQDMAVLEKKLQREAPLRKVVNSDSASMQDFANPNETLRTQTVLNALGYTGPNGEAVPETGQLDENTLYAWYLMRSDRDPFRSFSQEMHDFLAEMMGQNRMKSKWTVKEREKPVSRFRYFSPKEVEEIAKKDNAARSTFFTMVDGKAVLNRAAVQWMQESLASRGYTGPNGEVLRKDGVLDQYTLYAWFCQRRDEDFSNPVSEEIHELVSGTAGQESTRSDYEEAHWAVQQFWSGLVGLVLDPVRLYYNLFMEGDHDPENAKNAVGKALRESLVWQDEVNQAAVKSLEQIDDSTLGGAIAKNRLAPMIEELPGLLLDLALIYLTAGASTAVSGSMRRADTAVDSLKILDKLGDSGKTVVKKAVAGTIDTVKDPTFYTGVVSYTTEYMNEMIESGMSVEDALVRGLAFTTLFTATDKGLDHLWKNPYVSSVVNVPVKTMVYDNIVKADINRYTELFPASSLQYWEQNVH